jgi:hypothetical protein
MVCLVIVGWRNSSGLALFGIRVATNDIGQIPIAIKLLCDNAKDQAVAATELAM